MLARLQAGQHQADVAQAMGVSLTTLKKWLKRYREEGLTGLVDRTSRPKASPRQLPDATRTAIVTLRRERRTGRFIARELGVSAASVSRVLRRVHLSRWRELEPAAPVVRYQRERPGELIHLDVKKLGRIKGLGPAIAATANATAGSAGTTSTSRSTMPRAWRRPRSPPTNAATPRHGCSSAPSRTTPPKASPSSV
jgi:transposase-like protein